MIEAESVGPALCAAVAAEFDSIIAAGQVGVHGYAFRARRPPNE